MKVVSILLTPMIYVRGEEQLIYTSAGYINLSYALVEKKTPEVLQVSSKYY